MLPILDNLSSSLDKVPGLDGAKRRAAAQTLLRIAHEYFSPRLRESFFEALPGADRIMVERTETVSPPSGIEAMVASALQNVLGIRDPLVSALAELKAAGLNSSQALSAGRIFLQFVNDRAGTEILRQMAEEIPGLSRLR